MADKDNKKHLYSKQHKKTTTDKQVHGVKSESIRDKQEDMQSRTLQSGTNSAHSSWKHDMWMQRQQAIDTDKIYYPIKSTAAASSASFKTSLAILHFLSAATILTPEKPLWSNIFLSVWMEGHPEKHTPSLKITKWAVTGKKIKNDEWCKYLMKSVRQKRWMV